MRRLISLVLITSTLTACAKSGTMSETLAHSCIWNMVGYGCGNSAAGEPSIAQADTPDSVPGSTAAK